MALMTSRQVSGYGLVIALIYALLVGAWHGDFIPMLIWWGMVVLVLAILELVKVVYRFVIGQKNGLTPTQGR
jgi:hypothetical protein